MTIVLILVIVGVIFALGALAARRAPANPDPTRWWRDPAAAAPAPVTPDPAACPHCHRSPVQGIER